MATVELRTLGDCQILIGDARLGPQSPHAFAVALYLCIERGRPHSRDELQALFFPGVAEANAAHSLRQAVYKLRMLGLPCVTEPAGTVVPSCGVRDDFSALLASGVLPAGAVTPLPGTFLPGYWPRISDDYTRWLEAHRDAVNGALRRAYVARVVDRHAVARWDQVELYARACLQIDPLNEEATLGLAEALALNGSKVAGLKVLERYIEEVGVTDERLRIPAVVLRKRISERLAVNPARATEPALVGREVELRQLAMGLADSRTGAGQAIHISGEPGIGKTRLLREFLTPALLNGAQAIEVGAQPHDLRRPFSTIAELASQLLRASGALGAAPGSIATLRRLVTVDPGDVGESEPPVTSPAEMEARLAAALTDLVDAITQERSLIVAVEDVHWADSASRRVIDAILSDRRPRRLLWLLTSRGLPAGTLTRAASMPLRVLDGAESAHFVARYLEARIANPPAALAGNVLRLGGGNPFYLRSLCDYFADSGDYESTPPQLREIVLQRVRGLDARSRTVLSMCAVLGRYATMERLQETLEMPCHELTAALSELELEGLLRLRDGVLLLQHDLLSAAVLDETPDIARAVMRRAVARRLEGEGEASGELSLLWQAADHWTACGEPGKAKELFKACALHAARMGMAGEAYEALVRYVAVASGVDSALLASTLCSIIRFEIRDPMLMLRDVQTLAKKLPRTEWAHAFELTVLDASQPYRAPGSIPLDHLTSLVQDHRQSLWLRRKAASLAMRVADDTQDAILAHQMASCLGIDEMRLCEGEDPDFVRIYLMYHTIFGSEDVARSAAYDILRWADPTEAHSDSIRSIINAGIALEYLGELDDASRAMERTLTLCTNETQRIVAIAHLAVIARHAGNLGAESTWEEAIRAQMAATGLHSLNSTAVYYLARRAIDVEQWDAAESIIAELAARMNTPAEAAHWAMYHALRLRLAALRGVNPLPADTIKNLAEWSVNTAPRVHEDDIALAVVTALAVQSPDSARDYIRAYYARRGHRIPIMSVLARAVASLPPTESPNTQVQEVR